MSEQNVTDRLKEASADCIKAYDAWANDLKDLSLRETLQGHIHELRKVASRLEIDIAMSERDQMKSKRIPIPPHRSSKPQTGQNEGKNNQTHANNDANNEASAEVKKVMRRGRKPKAAAAKDE